MTNPSLQTLLDFAVDAAWQAGRLTLGYYQTNLTVERKADRTVVTEADRRAEQTLRARIHQHWPGHGLIGEEYGNEASDAEYTWVIDPIDGTTSFVHGVPFYATLLALTHHREPILGVIYLPALDDMLYAARGLGAYCNGRRARVSTVDRLADATVLTSAVNHFAPQGREKSWTQMVAATEVQRTWGDAYGYSLVATGRADLMLDPIANVWDFAPLPVILEEAGGRFTDWHGQPSIYNGSAIASNGLLHDAALALTQQDDR